MFLRSKYDLISHPSLKIKDSYELDIMSSEGLWINNRENLEEGLAGFDKETFFNFTSMVRGVENKFY